MRIFLLDTVIHTSLAPCETGVWGLGIQQGRQCSLHSLSQFTSAAAEMSAAWHWWSLPAREDRTGWLCSKNTFESGNLRRLLACEAWLSSRV